MNQDAKSTEGSFSGPLTFGDPVDAILESYASEPRIERLGAAFVPDRRGLMEVLRLCRDLIFPGFFAPTVAEDDQVREQTARRTAELKRHLHGQVEQALRYERPMSGESQECAQEARRIARRFLERIPELRRVLSMDVQAAYDGDPAATNTDETIFCYPGVRAVFAYRVAHALHEMGVPLLPRILSERVHGQTGIDIHPGARIGPAFFIDHGTGTVIGQTTQIGRDVRMYQGVTLGAHASDLTAGGRGKKRHPTLGDRITIYANATILGGQTVIGSGCVIGAHAFVTRSVPPDHLVTLKPPDLRYRSASRFKALAQRQAEQR